MLIDLHPKRHQLLAEVASLYYEAGLTQLEIAEEMDISRTTISRLLSEARERGVVTISINWPSASHSHLIERLQKQFGIQEIHIVQAGNRGYSQLLEVLGTVVTQLLTNKLASGMTLGIAWHTGIYQIAEALQKARQMGAQVVQLTGSTGASVVDGPDLSRWLSQILGSHYHYLPAPLVVDSDAIRQALLADHTIAQHLEKARGSDVALVSIDTISSPLHHLRQSEYLSDAEHARLIDQGAVGDIVTMFYDIHGEIIPCDFNQRVIGLPLDAVRQLPTVIGVAAGEHKAPAIVGALRGQFIDVLVTDDRAAFAVADYLDANT